MFPPRPATPGPAATPAVQPPAMGGMASLVRPRRPRRTPGIAPVAGQQPVGTVPGITPPVAGQPAAAPITQAVMPTTGRPTQAMRTALTPLAGRPAPAPVVQPVARNGVDLYTGQPAGAGQPNPMAMGREAPQTMGRRAANSNEFNVAVNDPAFRAAEEAWRNGQGSNPHIDPRFLTRNADYDPSSGGRGGPAVGAGGPARSGTIDGPDPDDPSTWQSGGYDGQTAGPSTVSHPGGSADFDESTGRYRSTGTNNRFHTPTSWGNNPINPQQQREWVNNYFQQQLGRAPTPEEDGQIAQFAQSLGWQPGGNLQGAQWNQIVDRMSRHFGRGGDDNEHGGGGGGGGGGTTPPGGNVTLPVTDAPDIELDDLEQPDDFDAPDYQPPDAYEGNQIDLPGNYDDPDLDLPEDYRRARLDQPDNYEDDALALPDDYRRARRTRTQDFEDPSLPGEFRSDTYRGPNQVARPDRYDYDRYEGPQEFRAPTAGDMEADPGYQFRVREGQRAIEHSRAASGMLRTTNTLNELVRFGQDMGSQEYGNVYNRRASEHDRRAGENRDTYQLGRDRVSDIHGTNLRTDLDLYDRAEGAEGRRFEATQRAGESQFDRGMGRSSVEYGRRTDRFGRTRGENDADYAADREGGLDEYDRANTAALTRHGERARAREARYTRAERAGATRYQADREGGLDEYTHGRDAALTRHGEGVRAREARFDRGERLATTRFNADRQTGIDVYDRGVDRADRIYDRENDARTARHGRRRQAGLDLYDSSFQNATTRAAPRMATWQARTAAGQRENELNFDRGWQREIYGRDDRRIRDLSTQDDRRSRDFWGGEDRRLRDFYTGDDAYRRDVLRDNRLRYLTDAGNV